jgi:hypothetical protein
LRQLSTLGPIPAHFTPIALSRQNRGPTWVRRKSSVIGCQRKKKAPSHRPGTETRNKSAIPTLADSPTCSRPEFPSQLCYIHTPTQGLMGLRNREGAPRRGNLRGGTVWGQLRSGWRNGKALVQCLRAYHALDACLPRAGARPSFETLMISIISTTQTQFSQQYRNNNVVGIALGPPNETFHSERTDFNCRLAMSRGP